MSLRARRSWWLTVWVTFGGIVGCSPRGAPPPASTARAQPAPEPSSRGRSFAWPAGKRAAVTLSYDDALSSQLSEAAPSLAKHRIRATFYVTEAARQNSKRWAQIAQENGHELGSHTLLHPCERAYDWVPKGQALEDYDQGRMQTELEGTLVLLEELGDKGPYTFAYPCGSTWLGAARETYVPLIRRLFTAARGTSSQPMDMFTTSLYDTPAVAADQHAAELVDLVVQNEQRGGWLVLLFHGIGSEHLSVDLESHERLLAYLDQRRDQIWTDTFRSVAAHVAGHRGIDRTF